MIIRTLTVSNWKCYSERRMFELGRHMILHGANGTGKTSAFQAILFAFTGKAPVGFTLNTVRFDETKDCSVQVEFEMGGEECSIMRSFGGKGSSCKLAVGGEVIAESARALDKWVDDHLNRNLLSILWTSSLVTNDILNVNFFTDVVLEEWVKEAKTLASMYRGDVRSYGATLNRLQSKLKPVKGESGEELDLDQVQAELDQKLAQLGGSAEMNKGESKRKLLLAESAKIAHRQLNHVDGDETLDVEDAEALVRFLSVAMEPRLVEPNAEQGAVVSAMNEIIKLAGQRSQIEKALEAEMAKRESKYAALDVEKLEHVVSMSRKLGVNLVDGSELNLEAVDDQQAALRGELANSGRSEVRIKKIKRDLAVANAFGEQADVQWLKQRLKNYVAKMEAERALAACEEWESILNAHSEQRNALMSDVKRLQGLLSELQSNKAVAEQMHGIREQIEQARFVADEIQQWVEQAVEGFSANVLAKASQYVGMMNSRYQQIAVVGKSFVVVVEGEDGVLSLLPVAQLSGGERTLVALALLFAVHAVFVPEIPMLFDETFVALDEENSLQAQRFLAAQADVQIFVITHDGKWDDGPFSVHVHSSVDEINAKRR